MTTLWLSLIAVFSAILGPFVLAMFQRYTAAEVARRLLKSNEAVAKQARLTYEDTATALADIHALVNSNLTSAQRRELDASRAMLAAMREVITMKEDRGMPVTPETLEAINLAEKQIADLARNLAYKQEIADTERHHDPNR